MRHYVFFLLVVLIVTPMGCVSLDAGGSFTRSELIRAFVDWREAERRRDMDLAREALYFESGSDETRLEEEFEWLKDVPGGTIRTEKEIHVAGHPEDWGPGEYLFLEPRGKHFYPSRAHIVSAGGRARIVYEPPPYSLDEQRNLDAAALGRMRLERKIRQWTGFDGEELKAEANRMLVNLRYQVEARQYAREEGIALARMQPDPAQLLMELQMLDDEGIRQYVIAQSKAWLNR